MKMLIYSFVLLTVASQGTIAAPLFEQELRALLENLREIIVKGCPQHDVPVLDPFQKDHYHASVEIPSIIGFELQFNDSRIEGLKNFVVNKIGYDLSASRLDYDITIPLLSFTAAHYNLNISKSLQRRNGKFDVAAVDFTVTGSAKFKIYKDSVNLTDFNIAIKMSKFMSNIEGLADDIDSNNMINEYLTELIPQLLEILQGTINSKLEPIVVDSVNSVLSRYTLAEIIDIITESVSL